MTLSGQKRYKVDIIPPELGLRRYLADEQSTIQGLEAELEAMASAMTELDEEHRGKDGLLVETRVVRQSDERRVSRLPQSD